MFMGLFLSKFYSSNYNASLLILIEYLFLFSIKFTSYIEDGVKEKFK